MWKDIGELAVTLSLSSYLLQQIYNDFTLSVFRHALDSSSFRCLICAICALYSSLHFFKCKGCIYFISLLIPAAVFITVNSRGRARRLSWDRTTSRLYLLSFSPGFWHLCILFWYLSVHHIKNSLKSEWSSLTQVLTGQCYIWCFQFFFIFTST